MSFLSEHRVYYLRLVSEFFQNFQSNEKKSKFWSIVKGIKIKVSVRMIQKLFQLLEGGVDEWSLDYDPTEVFSLVADLPADSESCIMLLTGFNTNTFPPTQRILHHIFTTIITPQGGGRCRLTETQRFLFFCLMNNIKVDLASVIMGMFTECLESHRFWPYAAHLTAFFIKKGVSLDREFLIDIYEVSVSGWGSSENFNFSNINDRSSGASFNYAYN